MSEKQEVTTKTVGFGFSVSIEREVRIDTGAKYPDKTVVKASLSGHADTYDEAVANLKAASEAVKEQIKGNSLDQLDVSSVPDLDIAEINDLPWRTFVKGSEPGSARPNRPGWIFSNEKGAEKLRAAIEKVGSVELGEWTFEFTGTDKSLIRRTKKKAK